MDVNAAEAVTAHMNTNMQSTAPTLGTHHIEMWRLWCKQHMDHNKGHSARVVVKLSWTVCLLTIKQQKVEGVVTW
jgi:hypothetical protein